VKIIGIILVRNEDIFLEQAVRNVLSACDRLLIADHKSSDGTPAIIESLRREYPEKIEARRIAEPGESHAMLQPYVGTESWIFGVDGDEIYDPVRLRSFFDRLREGQFRDRWMILGNVLNVAELSPDRATATGYLTPPCRSMTKLYNFSAIEAWNGSCPERLHGGEIRFRPGYDSMKRLFLHDEVSWSDAPFRCLHLCFLRRSTRDGDQPGVRKNIMDSRVRSWRKLLDGIKSWLRKRATNCWKDEVYKRGEAATLPVSEFFDRA
jgi:glycosyltransferase involved in cell wall biosynthesis